MAIGERIRFFRNLRGMTQKYLGTAVGFPEKTADIRMAQYESGSRTPKTELTNKLAEVFGVSEQALTVPDIDSYNGLMHTLFTLEDLYGLKITKLNGEICLHLDKGMSANYITMSEMFTAWKEQAAMLENGEITKQQYDEWRYKYPELDTSQYKTQENVNNHIENKEMGHTIPNIETYYLVDFENVTDAGLICSNQLGNHDHIHIFSTKNTPKISIESLSTFNSADFSSHNIPAGKQSLDMHLVTYLGYLIGKNSSKKCRYIIVSKDSDYDNIISFFKEFCSVEITRQSTIDSAPKKTTPAPAKTKPSTCKKQPHLQKHSLTMRFRQPYAKLLLTGK